jgi:hypothetical protein
VVSGAGGRIEIMPAQFTVKASDLKVLLAELRNVDPGLRKALQKEMRDDLKPIVSRLAAGVPSASPLSGFANAPTGSRWRWAGVSGRTQTPLGKRAKKPGFYPVVSMAFRSRGKAAGFEILELAGSKSSGSTPQGRGMIRALNAAAPMMSGLGRFLIPQAKGEAGPAVAIARNIIEKYVALVNRRIS